MIVTFHHWTIASLLATGIGSGFLAGLAVTGAPLLGVAAAILGATALYHAVKLSSAIH